MPKDIVEQEIPLKAAAKVLKLPHAGLRAVMRALRIEPKVGRSESNRMALLLTSGQIKKIQEALR